MNKHLLTTATLLTMGIVFSSALFTSCAPDDEEELQEIAIDKSLIVGHWVNSSDLSEHWKYEAMSSGKGIGVYWDASEMSYDEAAKGPGLFQYYFNETGLMRIYWMEMENSYSNPDTEAPFIIDVLNATTMTYHPHGSQRSYTFRKQPQ